MDYVFEKSNLTGFVELPESKSISHRRIFIAMLSYTKVTLDHLLICDDTLATLDAFQALGAVYEIKKNCVVIDSTRLFKKNEVMKVKASGTTLRFMIPICLYHGGKFTFEYDARLGERTLEVYEKIFKHVKFTRTKTTLTIQGKIKGGTYYVDGSKSSQFLSGLFFSLPLCEHDSRIHIHSQIVSQEYYKMTLDLLKNAGIEIVEINRVSFTIKGRQHYRPFVSVSEKDASAACFFEVAKYLGHSLEIEDYPTLHQKDAIFPGLLGMIQNKSLGINVTDIPDSVPALSLAMAISNQRYKITGASRLRDKESNRLESVAAVLNTLGANIEVYEDGLIINGVQSLHGGVVSSYHDHRIAMMTAIAATIADGEVILKDGDCVSKSWSNFYDVYKELGGKVHELSVWEKP